GSSAAGEGDAGGFVDADDVSFISGQTKGPTHRLDEYKLYALDTHGLALFKVNKVLMSSCELRGASGGRAHALAGLSVEPGPYGFRITSDAVDGANELALRITSDGSEGGIATIGASGYSPHSVDFEREEVTDLLVGSGYDMFRFRFDPAVHLRGRQVGDAFELSATGVTAGLQLQIRFEEERAEAGKLAARAQGAELEGDLGKCLRLWRELLDRYPFEERLTAEANATRARLMRVGRDEVSTVDGEIERARFFRLVDLYRQCLDSSLALEAKYEGSEVASLAVDVSARVRKELKDLEADLDREEVRRLGAILKVLEAQSAIGLASEVRTYMTDTYGSGIESGDDQGGR
ncbi:MAG: hypothetical protein ACI841_001499, partial [Planctomycetota bacterium]